MVGVAVLVGLTLTSRYNYLLFHSLAEIFVVVIAGGIFMLAWNTRRSLSNDFLLLVGIGLLFTALVQVLHMLAYLGMGILPEAGGDLATKLWLVARYLVAGSFLIGPIFLTRRLEVRLALGGFAAVVALLLGSIFVWDVFPTAFVEGEGLTPFKRSSEIAVAIALGAAIGLLYRRRALLDRGVYRLLVGALAFVIGSSIAFTLYVDVYGLSNTAGHLFNIVAFFLIYRAIIQTGLVKPHRLLYRDLTEAERRYRELFDQAPAMYVISRERSGGPVVDDCNTSFLTTLGYTREEVLGRPLADFYFSPEDGLARRPRQGTDSEPIEREARLRTSADEPIEVLQRSLVEPAFAGQPPGMRIMLVDISERKRIEAELRQAGDELHLEAERLEQRVRERTAELREANLALQRSSSRLKELSQRLVQAQEQERRTIARELHDEAGQGLTAVMIGLGLLEKERERPAPRIEELKQTVSGVMDGLHRLSANLRPAGLDRLGLVPALEHLARSVTLQSGTEVDLAADRLRDQRLPAEVEITLYRVVQEALTNVVRHSKARRASVLLDCRGAEVIAVIEDDGVGFDPDEAARGARLGLLGMRERVEILSGTLEIDTSPGAGCTIAARLPLGVASCNM